MMPIYEYKCQSCGEAFTKVTRTVSSSEDEELACPACGSENVQRVISSVSVVTPGGTEGRPTAEQKSGGESQTQETFGREELNQVLKQQGES